MKRIQELRDEVAKLYQSNNPDRADWADWIYGGHVLLVADAAKRVAEKYGGSPELAESAGLLHDVADAVMKREDPDHEERSFQIARDLLKKTGFTDEEIEIVVDDAIAKHGCHGDVRPISAEGKAMATADALVHITSDFYLVAERRRKEFQLPEEISEWALPKLERDFNDKVAFDEVRAAIRPAYEQLKAHFA